MGLENACSKYRSRLGYWSNGGLVWMYLGCCGMGSTMGLDRREIEHFCYTYSTFALLVLGRKSQPDGIETRDTFSAFGMYGFILVPVTYIATRLWQIRHPGPVVATSEGSLNSDMGVVLFIGAISFSILVIGHIISGMHLTKLQMQVEDIQAKYEEAVE